MGGKISCLDCSRTFSRIDAVKKHHNKIHLKGQIFNCEECKKCFTDENYMARHIKGAHMLPKIGANGSIENVEWQIIERNEDGRIKCFDCNGTFSSRRSAQ